MGVSHHSEDYDLMKVDFKAELMSYIGLPHLSDEYYEELTRRLFSIMNDYGAVDWT